MDDEKRAKPGTASPEKGSSTRTTGRVGIVVRRGATRRFEALKEKTKELPVEVMWDRRQGDRRTAAGPEGSDRRQGDRRKKPPFTWDTADFAVVADDAEGGGLETEESQLPATTLPFPASKWKH